MFLLFQIILLDRLENYESNGTDFIIFGALDVSIQIFEV
jgi:hypothetical protein